MNSIRTLGHNCRREAPKGSTVLVHRMQVGGIYWVGGCAKHHDTAILVRPCLEGGPGGIGWCYTMA